MKTLVVAIHGILTNQTTASWPDKLDAWMADHAPEIHVLKKEYRAGPFPRWNCWIKDPALAKSLANEIELFFDPAPLHAPRSDAPRVFIVAHSNGAVIALLAARILIQRGHKITGLILTGAACEADIAKNNILNWLSTSISPRPAGEGSRVRVPFLPCAAGLDDYQLSTMGSRTSASQPSLGFAISYSSPATTSSPGNLQLPVPRNLQRATCTLQQISSAAYILYWPAHTAH